MMKSGMFKALALPSFLIILMGSMDCLTTAIGVTFQGAAELNPFMAGIVTTSLGEFLVVKIVATLLIVCTFVLANYALMQAPNKSSRSFRLSCKLVKFAYGGVIAFLVIVVVNNLIILLA